MKGCLALLLLIALSACDSGPAPPIEPDMSLPQGVVTAHTTRLAAADPEGEAIAIAQAAFPATASHDRPAAILLVPQIPALAFTAMQWMGHPSVGTPLLYLSREGGISLQTLREMWRLNPSGLLADGKTQVYLAGVDAPEVVKEIEDALGYRVRAFPDSNPVTLAEWLDRWSTALGGGSSQLVISALDHADGLAYGIPALAKSVAGGGSFAWVFRNAIPEATRQILERRWGGWEIYLTGGFDVISDQVARELARYGSVHRIAGRGLFETAVAEAGQARGGGSAQELSGVDEGGELLIVNPREPLGAVAATLLARQGFAPLLLVEPQRVPPPVAAYLDARRPAAAPPMDTRLGHAIIIGDERQIALSVQYEIDRLLRPLQPPQERVAAREFEITLRRGDRAVASQN